MNKSNCCGSCAGTKYERDEQATRDFGKAVGTMEDVCLDSECECHQKATTHERNTLKDISLEEAEKLVAAGKAVFIPTHEIEGWEKDEDLVRITGYLNGAEAEYIKTFIASLLTHQQERIIASLEWLKKENKGQIVPTVHSEVGAYNAALTEAIEVVKNS